MKKIAAVAVIPLFAGFLWAQQDQATQTTTTTTKTTWNGTLVDAVCRSTTTTEHKESSSTSPDQSTTTKTESHSSSTTNDCPVTTTTTSFGLLTADGKYVRFDNPSNTKIVEIVKSNKKWNKYVSEKQPLKVQVVGAPTGEVVVMETIR